MRYIITTDWESIQERNIDPFSPVDSDNHNKLLKIFGRSYGLVDGFDMSLLTDDADDDGIDDTLLVRVQPGIFFKDYVVIEFNQPAILQVFSLIETSIQKDDRFFVVLEYTYVKRKPAPYARIRVIRANDFRDRHQLKIAEIIANENIDRYNPFNLIQRVTFIDTRDEIRLLKYLQNGLHAIETENHLIDGFDITFSNDTFIVGPGAAVINRRIKVFGNSTAFVLPPSSPIIVTYDLIGINRQSNIVRVSVNSLGEVPSNILLPIAWIEKPINSTPNQYNIFYGNYYTIDLKQIHDAFSLVTAQLASTSSMILKLLEHLKV